MKTVYLTRFIAAVVLAAAPAAFAQLDRGSITGTVFDSTGAAIPGAKVTVRQAETQTTWQSQTNSAGQYTVPYLPAGTYELRYEAPAFKTTVRTGIQVGATAVVRADATLEVGATTESVQVTAGVPLVQTDTPEVSATLSNEKMVDLPFSFSGGRLMENMTYKIMPGIYGNRWTNTVNGSVHFTRDALLDGASTTTWMQGTHVLVSFSLEAVQEFKVMESGISAEFGKSAGGLYNYVFKSGTNELHGSLYGSIRNEVFNANSFANNARGIGRTPDRRWNYAMSLGGPVYIPKVINGKNKFFFYAAFEHYKERSLTFASPNRTVPLPEFYAGDFSRLLRTTMAGTDALGRPVMDGAIYDPATFRQVAGGRWVGDMFPGNRMPASRITPQARNMNELMRKHYLPNFTDATGQVPLVNNFFGTTSPIPITDDYFFSVKMDYIINDAHKLSGSYNRDYNFRLIGAQNGLWDASHPHGGPLTRTFWRREPGQLSRMHHDWTISPTKLNHITVAVNRYSRNDAPPEQSVDGAAVLGISGLSTLGYPDINWSGGPFVPLTQVGFQQSTFEAATAYSILDTFSFSKGKHFLKAGADIRYNHYNQRPLQGTTFNFHPRATAIPNEPYSGNRTGYAMASYMLGIVDSGAQNDPVGLGMRLRYYSFFFQDDWKVSPKLTLNLGLRWEYQPPQYEAADRLSSWNPAKTDPESGLPGAYDFAGNCNVCTGNRTFGRRSLRDWAPRFGLAYQFLPKWTLRAAYGIYFAPEMFNNFGGTMLGKPTNVQAGGTFQLEPNPVQPYAGIFNWANGFPGASYIPPVYDLSWGNRNRPGMIHPDYGRTGYSQNWNLNIQRELPGRTVVDLGYIGNKASGFKFGDLAVVNQLDPATLGTHGTRYGNQVTNPAQAAANGVAYPYNGFRGTVASALRPFPQMQGNSTLRVYGAPIGYSNYHSLQVSLNKELTRGLLVYTSYVWAKTLTNIRSAREGVGENGGRPLDYYNLKIEKGLAEEDRPHFFKFFGNYEVPFGRGRALWGGATGWKNVLISGWAVSAVLTYGSGSPMTFTGSFPSNLWNGNVNRANVKPGDLTNPSFDRGSFDASNPGSPVNTYLIKSQFSDPAPLTLGSVARTVGNARFPATLDEDIAVIKNTYIGEKYRFQIRADLLTAFNRTWPTGIPTVVTNPQFGQATGRAGNRIVQLGVRLDF
jgi:hypothetical protein